MRIDTRVASQGGARVLNRHVVALRLDRGRCVETKRILNLGNLRLRERCAGSERNGGGTGGRNEGRHRTDYRVGDDERLMLCVERDDDRQVGRQHLCCIRKTGRRPIDRRSRYVRRRRP